VSRRPFFRKGQEDIFVGTVEPCPNRCAGDHLITYTSSPRRRKRTAGAVRAAASGFELDRNRPCIPQHKHLGCLHPGKVMPCASEDYKRWRRDNESFPFPVCILETIGRNAGWLAASTVLAARSPEDGPQLVYVPELPFLEDRFLAAVDDLVPLAGALSWQSARASAMNEASPCI
jgi:hypothetical protein